jgi:hypothetical protein
MMTFHESYGDLPKSTLALIKRHNVSPCDYDELVAEYGDNFAAIETAIVTYTVPSSPSFSLFEFWNRK